ncbi:MAG: Rrf2 family transcriptional regulator [Planctomycetota bacterium]
MNSDFAIGLHIVGFLTARQGQPLTSETLADTYGTSPVVVRRVLSRLQQAGLIETRRGTGGGSVLAQKPSAINLRQVYEAVTDNPQFLRRHPGEEGGVAPILGAYINELCSQAELALLEQLESVTVKQMDAAVRPRIIASHCRTKPKSKK